MPKSILTLIALLFCLAGFSQSSGKTQRTRHYFFTHYTTTSGLISYQINSTVQDEDGYIWIGTNDGLQRYDGVRFKTFHYRENDSTTLPSNLISQLLMDKDQNLWVLTANGKAGIFNTKSFKFSRVTIRCKNESFFLSNAPSKRLIMDESGNIFLLVPGSEVITYIKTARAFVPTNNFPGLKLNFKIKGFAQEPGTQKYWMCADELGLVVYNNASEQLSYAGNNAGKEKIIDQLGDTGEITNIYFDKSGRLWFINTVGDIPSISCYDMRKQQMVISNYHFNIQSIGFHQVRSFFEQKDGTIWVIGQQIFARFLEKEKQFEQVYNGYESEHGIDYISISSLMEDRELNMWACTANNGIFRYNPAKDFFSNSRYLSHITKQQGGGAPVSFMQDKDESILFGTREDGFYRFDKNLQQVPLQVKGIPDKNNIVIWAMCRSADSNTIWMIANRGLYKYDQHKKSISHFQSPALKNNTIRQVLEDNEGKLWFGTQDAGVLKWDPVEGKKKFDDGMSAITGIPAVRINRIIKDRKGFIWIATNTEGAYMVNPENDSIVHHFHTGGAGEMKLPEQSTRSVLDYNDSLVIIGCESRLMVYNRLRRETNTLGSPLSGFISSIEKDDNGYLWVSTSTSIYRVTVSNRVFLLFNRNDGLENDYFLPGASYVLPDKRMLFGTYGVIINFLPSALNTSPMFPDLRVTGFTVKDKSLRVDSLLHQKAIVLQPEENSMTIDLSVLSYNSGYLLKYKLENLDKEWKTVDQNYQLIYSYLPSGNYTLLVNTVDADGRTGEKTLKLSIRVNPPFWKTWWFYGMLFLLLMLFLFWLDSQRMKRREVIQKMRSNIAGNLHREVNTALNNINILSEMAKLKADNNPEKSKEFIGQINVKSEQMIIAMDDMLWSIDPGNDSTHKTVERLREFIEALNNRHDAGIEMLVDNNVEKIKLDMQLRHEALLLFKENIYTQVMSGGRDINIHIRYEKSNLVYSTQFHPETCNIKQLNNFLYSKEMEKKLLAIHAKLSVDANKSNLLVVMKVPVG
ncbi:MAG: two-component regulator propeller domain-containing protein [Chitinophagaceae bacterium]